MGAQFKGDSGRRQNPGEIFGHLYGHREGEALKPLGVARPGGLEPPAFGFVVQRSIRLSYGRARKFKINFYPTV